MDPKSKNLIKFGSLLLASSLNTTNSCFLWAIFEFQLLNGIQTPAWILRTPKNDKLNLPTLREHFSTNVIPDTIAEIM